MIDLYTWATPNGYKVSIMLEEIGIAYRVFPIDISKDEQFAAKFLKISPNNKIPAIVDRERDVALMESGAILLYLAEKSGRLAPDSKPRDAAARWQLMQWLMFQMGGLGPMLGQAHHFLRFNPGVSEYAEKRYAAEAKRLYGVLEKRLAETATAAGAKAECGYLAGEYSLADIAAWPWVARFGWQGIDLNEFPNVKRWYLAIASRPAVQRGYRVPKKDAEIPMPAE